MFVDELKIYAKAGHGGDGVVRWRREKFKPEGGPSGGNGGKGGDVYIRAVRNLNQLAKYTGTKEFRAENAESGGNNSLYGKKGKDCFIDVPIGSSVTDQERGRVYELNTEGQIEKILHGGSGGLGNEYFKSSTNRSPDKSTKGKQGEGGTFLIEVTLAVDAGFIGLPNAGKSTLLNTLTNSKADIGAYPFTTLEPHIGDFFGHILADIPGLIEGASKGKGLGYKFLKHITRTNMLLHLISLEENDPISQYQLVRNEIINYEHQLEEKEEGDSNKI